MLRGGTKGKEQGDLRRNKCRQMEDKGIKDLVTCETSGWSVCLAMSCARLPYLPFFPIKLNFWLFSWIRGLCAMFMYVYWGLSTRNWSDSISCRDLCVWYASSWRDWSKWVSIPATRVETMSHRGLCVWSTSNWRDCRACVLSSQACQCAIATEYHAGLASELEKRLGSQIVR